ncbi:rod shape-determining protein MreC [Pseudobdellovibrio exovorus]|uniref:Cell shape-determining protein MreC n=1 Tax=Pseudobdellovibrio exovorus JSS TaxID=1184267 RepID=M4V7K9_9BACT|nr:rod shape-determining protein MreC [Pseudobdellovibrio exovorus]AGH95198.1 rod shape-determining protein MreC [Pseudobdellovibrio exovorus JSS]
MNFLNFNFKKALILLAIISLPLISINMEQKTIQDSWFSQPFTFLAQSVQSLFFNLSEGVRATTAEYINIINVKTDNQSLKKENDELKARLNLFTENQNELERLRTLLDFQNNTKMELIPAQVIGRNLVTDHNTITINKGTDHGLKAGQAVLTVSGAVGHIFQPSSRTAHVMLITDRYSVVDALIQRTRAHGLIEGKTKDTCILQYVERTEDVKDGDLIVTGGLDNIFPKGFPLGVITNVERKTKNTSLQIEVKPVVDSNKVEEVFIVKSAALENFLKDDQKASAAIVAPVESRTTNE